MLDRRGVAVAAWNGHGRRALRAAGLLLGPPGGPLVVLPHLLGVVGANVIEGQLNLRDALDRTIDFTSPEGKSYALGADLATIVVRPRGWHLPEKHIVVDGRPMSGGLVDFGLYFFHCAQRQIDA
ncbi:MAG TPA: hypothetical protein VIL87_03535, partial [Dermatophilaceae bacterium]